MVILKMIHCIHCQEKATIVTLSFQPDADITVNVLLRLDFLLWCS